MLECVKKSRAPIPQHMHHSHELSLGRHGALLEGLDALGGHLLHGLLAGDDALDLREDGGPGVEFEEGHVLLDAVGDEIVALLGEEQVRLLGGREVGDAVAGVEHRWSLALGQRRVGPDCPALVVSKAAAAEEAVGQPSTLQDGASCYMGRRCGKGANSRLVAEHNLPPLLLIDVLPRPRANLVADDLHPARVRAHQLVQQRANEGGHAPAQNDNRDVVRPGPVVEGPEAGVEVDLLEQDLGALVEGGGDGVEHGLEGVAEGDGVGEDLLVQREARGAPEPQIVRHVVVGVAAGDGAVEVGEEDEFGRGGHGREVGGVRRRAHCALR